MRIGIIGAGNVGGALGTGWAAKGHEVIWGVRDPNKASVKELVAKAGANASAGTITEAADAGDVVVLATPWEAAQGTVQTLGDLGNKPLLDTTNPLKADLSGLSVSEGTSGGEQVAAWSPDARVVKIFNTTGFGNMADPVYPTGATAMLYCGDNTEAKAIAHRLAADLGFDPIDFGPLQRARLLEEFAVLWITLAYPQGLGRDFAFQLVRR